jgi:hypothetical protein
LERAAQVVQELQQTALLEAPEPLVQTQPSEVIFLQSEPAGAMAARLSAGQVAMRALVAVERVFQAQMVGVAARQVAEAALQALVALLAVVEVVARLQTAQHQLRAAARLLEARFRRFL